MFSPRLCLPRICARTPSVFRLAALRTFVGNVLLVRHFDGLLRLYSCIWYVFRRLVLLLILERRNRWRLDGFCRHSIVCACLIGSNVVDFFECNSNHTHNDGAQKKQDVYGPHENRHAWRAAPFYTKRQENCKFITIYSQRGNKFMSYALKKGHTSVGKTMHLLISFVVLQRRTRLMVSGLRPSYMLRILSILSTVA